MTERLQVYKCDKCGMIVEVLHGGAGTLECCGQPMRLLKPGVTDGAVEKHVPVVEKKDKGLDVKVGSAPHPMEDKHWVEWIEVIDKDGNVQRRYLNPHDKPEAFFEEIKTGDGVTVREYCNLHGLWQTEVK